MVRVTMHGVRIAYDANALPRDPLGSFFDPFPDRDAGPADLTIILRSGAPALHEDELIPFFFHGMVQVYRLESQLIVAHPGACATVAVDGSRIDATVAPSVRPENAARVLHVALGWAFRARALFDLHAAAVVAPGDDRSILIVGDSGSGKTTLTLAFLEAGFSHLGDDRVLVRRDARVEVFSYPRAFHLGAATLRAFPHVAAHTSMTDEAKCGVDPKIVYPSAFRTDATLPALLLLPRIVDDETTALRPVTQADAFGQLLASSAILAVDGMTFRDENLACIRDLASLPAFELLAGRDMLRDPRGVARNLERMLEARQP